MIDGNSDLRRPKFRANIPHFNTAPSVRWGTVIISAIEEGPVIISVAEKRLTRFLTPENGSISGELLVAIRALWGTPSAP